MGLLTKGPRGTQDVLPKESYQWQVVEDAMRRICSAYGFKEIRTPVFEHTELFQRSVGETTDVVQKEMYTFQDKGGRSITLRPEGTAGAACITTPCPSRRTILPPATGMKSPRPDG